MCAEYTPKTRDEARHDDFGAKFPMHATNIFYLRPEPRPIRLINPARRNTTTDNKQDEMHTAVTLEDAYFHQVFEQYKHGEGYNAGWVDNARYSCWLTELRKCSQVTRFQVTFERQDDLALEADGTKHVEPFQLMSFMALKRDRVAFLDLRYSKRPLGKHLFKLVKTKVCDWIDKLADGSCKWPKVPNFPMLVDERFLQRLQTEARERVRGTTANTGTRIDTATTSTGVNSARREIRTTASSPTPSIHTQHSPTRPSPQRPSFTRRPVPTPPSPTPLPTSNVSESSPPSSSQSTPPSTTPTHPTVTLPVNDRKQKAE
eukprot:m.219053 g.219053  ORF g.219053 m.219053 type:complete len:317 (-) comp33286_c2_seq2:120-1070(-)